MTSARKYLIVIPTDELGGAEQLLKTLGRYWVSNGHNVQVLCLTKCGKGSGWEDWIGDIRYQNTANVYRGLALMQGSLSVSDYDLVMSSQVYINGALGILRKLGILKTKKLVVRESTSIFVRFTGVKKEGYRQFYRLGYSYADLVIYQTDFMKNQLEENVKKAKFWPSAILDNPLDLEHILNKSNEQSEVVQKVQYIIGVGRLIPQKGFDILIKAFANIVGRYQNLSLLIIGEGAERTSLEKQVEELDIQDKVIMPGFVSNPFPLMKNAELCVLSSRIEGFPNTLLQMMALNSKVVTTLCAGGVEYIPFVEQVEPGNLDEMIGAIQRKLDSQGINEADRLEYLRKRSVHAYIQALDNHLHT